MAVLKEMKCEACQAGAKAATTAEIETYLQQLPQWHIVQHGDIPQLRREFQFSNFVQALAFTNQVGELAEAENHHPEIVTEWGKATVTWWTHVITGLHINDFILAAKAEALYEANRGIA